MVVLPWIIETRVVILREKIIPLNTEQTEILINFVAIPPVLRTENAENSDQSNSAEDRNTRNLVISFLTISWKI